MAYLFYQYFSFIIVFFYLLLGSYTDFKRREVSDWLNYSFFIFAIVYNVILSFYFSTFNFILNSFFGFLFSFFVSFMMYYFGKWGGGDAKVLINLGLFFGISIFNLSLSFFLNLLLNIIILGSFYGILWFFYLFLRSLFYRKYYKNYKLILGLLLSFVVFVLFSYLSFKLVLYYMFLINLFLSFVSFLTLVLFLGRYVESFLVTKKVSVSSLVDGDWIDHRIHISNDSYSFFDFICMKDGLFFRDLSLWFKFKAFLKFKNINYAEFVLFCEHLSKLELEHSINLNFNKIDSKYSDLLYLKPDLLVSKLDLIKLDNFKLYKSIKSFFSDSGYYINYFNFCDGGNCSVNASIISFLINNFPAKRVSVKEGVPFVPGIFLAFIFTFLFHKSILFIFKMIIFIN